MRGFGLIEVVIVVAIVAVISSLVYFSLSSFRENQVLSNTASELALFVDEARSKTVSSEAFSQFGVHIATTSLTIFKGESYSPSEPENILLEISPLMEIHSISLNGGGNDVVFQRNSGKTDQHGSFSIRSKNDAGKSKTIIITATGLTDVE